MGKLSRAQHGDEGLSPELARVLRSIRDGGSEIHPLGGGWWASAPGKHWLSVYDEGVEISPVATREVLALFNLGYLRPIPNSGLRGRPAYQIIPSPENRRAIPYPHLRRRYAPIADYDISRRTRMLSRPIWVDYPRATEILEELNTLLNAPSSGLCRNVLLVGEPRSGKSALVKTFRERHGQGYVDESSATPVKPVLIARPAATAGERELYFSILDCFWTPYSTSWPTERLRGQLIAMVRHCRTKILILDDISFLRGRGTRTRQLINILKDVTYHTDLSIVAVAEVAAGRVLLSDPQMVSRYAISHLSSFLPNRDFQCFLAKIERRTPLKFPSGLHRPEIARKLYQQSAGNIGRLTELVRSCAEAAIHSGEEQISGPCLVDKAEDKSGVHHDRRNPDDAQDRGRRA